MKPHYPFWKKYSILEDLEADFSIENLPTYEDYLNSRTVEKIWYNKESNVSPAIRSFMQECLVANLSVKEFRQLFEDEIYIDIIEGEISAGYKEKCYYQYQGKCLYLRHKFKDTIVGNYPLLGSGFSEALKISPEVFEDFFGDCWHLMYIGAWKHQQLTQIVSSRD
ncbi:hypothetical protein [Gloeothece verrucosa]|uniref:Uncharacterized protein n=1 Tax=Gloeothece verrucosa (strain PCC 7822) TaxID=497965 RepID=E0UD25_GLOV7|nr:hypothetical protein [Gloeothece verrucosa]ADN12905.1 hypothetical protein Cyan7822_0888 [Gloeothece verrucosa PCC 7822]